MICYNVNSERNVCPMDVSSLPIVVVESIVALYAFLYLGPLHVVGIGYLPWLSLGKFHYSLYVGPHALLLLSLDNLVLWT